MGLWFPLLLALGGLGMGLEAWAGKRRGRSLYSAGPTLSNFGCGLLRGVVGFPIQGLLLAGYASVHARFGILELDPTRATHWLAALLAYDFLYYWAHRASHRVPILWAGHAVHHQPDELNLSVLFRAPVAALVQTFPLYLTLAILGVPPLMYATVAVIVHASMLWLHTRMIPELLPVSWIFNTPALHRVHHSSAHDEGTRNFGGLFAIWDRLFGTHRAPTAIEPSSYGIEGHSPPQNPLTANLAPFRSWWRESVRSRWGGSP
jgi:sterol desaturase/sphingolipid hydroxylase (fatty acid hydroxylase superfamily)